MSECYRVRTWSDRVRPQKVLKVLRWSAKVRLWSGRGPEIPLTHQVRGSHLAVSKVCVWKSNWSEDLNSREVWRLKSFLSCQTLRWRPVSLMIGYNGDYVEAYHSLTGEHFFKAGCMVKLDWNVGLDSFQVEAKLYYWKGALTNKILKHFDACEGLDPSCSLLLVNMAITCLWPLRKHCSWIGTIPWSAPQITGNNSVSHSNWHTFCARPENDQPLLVWQSTVICADFKML